MELIGIWWLLDRRRSPWRFWVVIVVLVVFHLVSIKSVGFFYPVVMAALVSCFLWQRLDWPWPKNEAKEAFPRFFKSPFQFCRSIWVAMSWQFKLAWLISLIFLGIQFIPASISPRNDLSGEGRLIASSMVHNRTECRGFMVGRWGVHEAKLPMPVMQLPIRIWCDPLVFYNYARLVCRQKSPDRLDWYLLSRNSSEEAYQLIIRAEDFCRDSRRFPWFGSLPWRAE
jgi:hypothetical protein